MQVSKPENWEICDFESITINEKIKKIKIKTNSYQEKGNYPIIDQGQKLIAGFTDDSSTLYNGTLPVIIFGDHTLIVKFVDFPFAIGADGTKIINVNQKKCFPRFLYYAITGKNLQSEGYKRHFSKLREEKFLVPSLEEQHKIASILSNVDSLIQQTQKEIEQTQRLKKGLMQRLLTKGIGHKKFKKVKSLFGKYEEIPEEWETKKIKDLTKVSVGLVINPSTYFDKNGTIPMITGKNVTENGIVLDDVDFITEESNKLLETTRIWVDDLVTMRVGYPGRTSVVKSEHNGINCASVIITRGNKKFVSRFLGYLANSRVISKQITMHQAGGAQQVVNIGSWKEFLIPFPPIQEQQKIVSILSNMDSLIQKQQEYKSKLELLKKGLMQKLLTGQIRVKV